MQFIANQLVVANVTKVLQLKMDLVLVQRFSVKLTRSIIIKPSYVYVLHYLQK